MELIVEGGVAEVGVALDVAAITLIMIAMTIRMIAMTTVSTSLEPSHHHQPQMSPNYDGSSDKKKRECTLIFVLEHGL